MFPENRSAGFELARALRHFHENLQDIPIVLLTAVNTRFLLGFSTQDIDDDWLPVADFVEKPVDLNVLHKKVTTLLAQTQAKTPTGENPAPHATA